MSVTAFAICLGALRFRDPILWVADDRQASDTAQLRCCVAKCLELRYSAVRVSVYGQVERAW